MDIYMQTIYRAVPASNFTQIDNTLIASAMPPQAKNVLIYLLSKPDNWRLRVHDLRKQLGISTYAAKKALAWLQSAGYALYTRLKTGHTIWKVYSDPHPIEQPYRPVIPPQVEIPHVAIQPVLETLETEQIQKQQPAVVVSDDLIYPVQLDSVQKKAAKAVIKKCKVSEMRQPVLFALAYAITAGTVKSPVAYLNGLISRANDGTFEAVTVSSAVKQVSKPIIPIWQGHKKAPAVDNNAYMLDMIARYGDKAKKAIQF
jgi:hypothetical protein